MGTELQKDGDALSSYLEEFGATAESPAQYPKDTKLAKAYEIALDIRKFEIELYWKRAGYFWVLLAALAAALGIVLTAGSKEVLPMVSRERIGLFISCAASVLAICWMVVNHASKSWQRNWEMQVDVLEDAVVGPLYKTVMFKDKNSRIPHDFSISNANYWISCYFIGVFITACIYFGGVGRYPEWDWIKVSIVLVNLAFIGWFLHTTRTSKQSRLSLKISYTRRHIEPGSKTGSSSM